jgi:hypothetical protein
METKWIYCLVLAFIFSDALTNDPVANQLIDYKKSHVSYKIVDS